MTPIDFRTVNRPRPVRPDSNGLRLTPSGNLTVSRDSLWARLLFAISTDPERPTSRAGILAALGCHGSTSGPVDDYLTRLVRGGVVERVGQGQYVRIWHALPDGVTGGAA